MTIIRDNLDHAAKAVALLTSIAAASAGAQVLIEESKFNASDAGPGHFFGLSVATDGSTAVVGAPRNEIEESYSGAAYVFDLAANQELAKLTVPGTVFWDQFGVSVAVEETFALVGAPDWYDSPPSDYSPGPGYVYVFDTTTGKQLHRLQAADAFAREFGNSVAISGTSVIVGAPRGNSSASGTAYLFDYVSGEELHKLDASDRRGSMEFGCAVAISGTTAIVGARRQIGPNGEFRFGAAYLFDTDSGQELFKLIGSDTAVNDYFGSVVAISGNLALVGVPKDTYTGGQEAGSVYVFDIETGQEIRKIIPSDFQRFGHFGNSVSIDGSTAVIGAREGAYVYDVSTGEQLYRLSTYNQTADPWFGWPAAFSGTSAVVSSSQDGDAGVQSGAVYVYDLACPADIAAPFGELNFFDVSTYIAEFLAQTTAADIAQPYGILAIADIAEFLSRYLTGCL